MYLKSGQDDIYLPVSKEPIILGSWSIFAFISFIVHNLTCNHSHAEEPICSQPQGFRGLVERSSISL